MNNSSNENEGKVLPLGDLRQLISETRERRISTAKDGEIASVIVTIRNGRTYDELFSRMKQTSEYGRIVIYEMEPGTIMRLVVRVLQGEAPETFKHGEDSLDIVLVRTLKQFKLHCDEAGPEAVCFNFECSGGYSTAGFGKGLDNLHIDLTAFCVKVFGCLCMFSDFSLKALISKWNPKLLGPNPFVQTGVFSGKFTLSFDPEVLKKCSSAQLNTVGSLTEARDGKGTCSVHAITNTIVYTITRAAAALEQKTKEQKRNKMVDDTYVFMEPYEVEVLTVSESFYRLGFISNLIDSIKTRKLVASCNAVGVSGAAGHVVITYPASKTTMERFEREKILAKDIENQMKEEAIAAGFKVFNEEVNSSENVIVPARGRILASCGHWIELMKIDVNMNRLLETVRNDWGGEENAGYREYSAALGKAQQMDPSELERTVQSSAADYVQSRPAAKFNHKLVHKKNVMSKFSS